MPDFKKHPKPWTLEVYDQEFNNVICYIKDARGQHLCDALRGGPGHPFSAKAMKLIAEAIAALGSSKLWLLILIPHMLLLGGLR